MAVTLLNVFVVPEETEAEFLDAWNETTSNFKDRRGFIETHLHRNMSPPGGELTFRFINIATWESKAALTAAYAAHKPREESIAGVRFHPAIYESIIDVVKYPAA